MERVIENWVNIMVFFINNNIEYLYTITQQYNQQSNQQNKIFELVTGYAKMITDTRHYCLILEIVVIGYNDILFDMVIDYISNVTDYVLLKSLFFNNKDKVNKNKTLYDFNSRF